MKHRNAHRTGYKHTPIGWIPEDWTWETFHDIITELRGGAPLTPHDFIDLGFKVLPKSGVCKGGMLSIDIKQQQYCSEKYANEHQNNVVNEKYIIVVLRDLVPAGPNIGLMVKIPYQDQYILAQGVYGFKTKKLVNSDYLIQYSNSNSYRRLMQNIMVGSTQVHITISEFDKVIFPLPPLPEQQKIAEILGTWDRAIETQTKLIAAKKKRKKALMQQLLTGKKRVQNGKPWKKTKFSDCLTPTSYPVDKPVTSYYSLGIRSHGKGTLTRFVEDPAKVLMDTLYKVKKGELILNITFAWEGAVTILSKEDEGKLVSHRFPTFSFNRNIAIPEYFAQLIRTKRFVHYMGLISPGGAGRNRVLDQKDFLELEWNIPSIEEQQAIAAVLQTADKEIECLERRREVLRTQKKGLMQKLLTGEVRVKI